MAQQPKHSSIAKRKINSSTKSGGFTLVEVMISMVVFAMLMVLVSGAMSFATRYWTKENVKLSDKMAEYIYVEKLSRAIAAAQPYGIYFGRSERLELFFHGANKELRFVSDTGLYEHGPVIIALRVVDSRDDGIRVDVAEYPMRGAVLTRDSELANIEWQWKPLKTNATLARFVYYGYDSINELQLQRSVSTKEKAVVGWYDDYNGRQRNILPQKIALEWQEVKQGKAVNFVMEFPIMIDDKNRYNFIEHSKNVKSKQSLF